MTRAILALALAALIPTTAEAAHCRVGQYYRPSLAACQWHPYRAEHVHHAHRMLAHHSPRVMVRTVVRTRTIVRTIVVHDKTIAAAPVAWANLARPKFGATQ